MHAIRAGEKRKALKRAAMELQEVIVSGQLYSAIH
jgi:hypothetical protein